jgi:hypothetical protein
MDLQNNKSRPVSSIVNIQKNISSSRFEMLYQDSHVTAQKKALKEEQVNSEREKLHTY